MIKESLPRGVWKLGKIQELISSQDGQIRTAKVLLPTHRVLNRRINLLCPIECPANESHHLDDNANAQPVDGAMQTTDGMDSDDNDVPKTKCTKPNVQTKCTKINDQNVRHSFKLNKR